MNFKSQWQNFAQEIQQPDQNIDLAKAALYFAQTEYPHLNPEEYLHVLDTMAADLRKRLPESHYPLKMIKIINQYLFKDLGFVGNTTDYYDPRNSFLNQVIERRTGIPLSLSMVYLEIAKRLDFPMVGIGMPGHFLIRPDFEGAGIFVDAFSQGEILFEQDCEHRLQQVYQQPIKLEPTFLNPVSNREILTRMLTNLKIIYINNQQYSQALNIVDGILLLFPDHPREIRDQGLLYYQLGYFQQAIKNLERYLAISPNADDATTIRDLLDKIS